MPGTTEDVYGTGGSFASYLSGYGLRVPAIAGITQPLLVPSSWLDFIAEDYGFNVGRWVYAREHYTGEVAAPWRIAAYLIRKKIGETIEAFEERVLLADYTPYFGAVVDTLAGMLSSREDETSRAWGKTAKGNKSKRKGPLGDTEDPGSILGKLWLDADGHHNSWTTLWQLLCTELVAVHDAWILVDGGQDGGRPTVKILQAESVPNWRYEGGVLVEAVVKEHADVRTSVEDNPRQGYEAQWIRFTTTGWSRWHKVKKTEGGGSGNPSQDEEPEQIDAGTYTYVTRDGKPTIPLYQVRLPLKRNVGYLMARKVNAIFNKESERDHLLRFATFPLLVIVGNDSLYKNILDKMRQGARIIQGQPGQGMHEFIAPEAAPAATLDAAIKAKVEAFYATAFSEFASSVGRASRDRVTATEVLAQKEAGIEAFLSVLANAMDGAENAALFYIEQTVFPKDQSKWGQASVTRPRTFGPISPQEAIKAMKERYIGAGPVPIGRAGLIDVVNQITDFDDVDVDDKEVAAAVDAAQLTPMVQLLASLLPLMPDELKAELIAQWGEANGYGDQEELKKLALEQLKKAPPPAPAVLPPGGGPPPKPGEQPPSAEGAPRQPKPAGAAGPAPGANKGGRPPKA